MILEEQENRFPILMKWRLTLAETLAFGMSVAMLVLWLNATFQAKSDANEWKASIENRMFKMEAQMNQIQMDTKDIAKGVEYIRGRLEPKNQNQ